MELKFLPLDENDYDVLCEYWKQWNFPAPPKKCLPNNAQGGIKIINDEGVIICAGFLYESNSAVAWIEFIISNPNIKDRELRHRSLVELISFLTVEAEEKGFSAVVSSLNNQSLIEKFVEVGYTKSTLPSTEVSIVVR